MAGCFVIAEAGVNHNGDLDLAIDLVDAAVAAGADAVKFQVFQAEQLLTDNTPKANYQLETTNKAQSQYEMIKELELGEPEFIELARHCSKAGIEFLATPFDHHSLKFLAETLNVKRLKVSSGDLTNAPLLLACAQTNLPLILSTGMASLAEIEHALRVVGFGLAEPAKDFCEQQAEQKFIGAAVQDLLREKVSILHCSTEYPADVAGVHLRVMETLETAFRLTVGYSDHTAGIAVSVAAAARGARIIEKHFALDRGMEGPDHRASLEPHELKEMVTMIRQVETAIGSSVKLPSPSELETVAAARKSLVATDHIEPGQTFNADNMGVKRPGSGVSPAKYWNYLGRVAKRGYIPGDLLVEE